MKNSITTKEVILYNSISLFADKGYESVSLKNIASSVGIQASSIYNHYASKEMLLSSIYQFFEEHYYSARPSREDYEIVLRQGSAVEIIEIFNFPVSEPALVMFDLTRFLWARQYTDPYASMLYHKHVIDGSFAYIREVFGLGVEIGRILMSESDLEDFAMAILSTRAFSASAVVADPDQLRWHTMMTNALRFLSNLLVLSPPIS